MSPWPGQERYSFVSLVHNFEVALVESKPASAPRRARWKQTAAPGPYATKSRTFLYFVIVAHTISLGLEVLKVGPRPEGR